MAPPSKIHLMIALLRSLCLAFADGHEEDPPSCNQYVCPPFGRTAGVSTMAAHLLTALPIALQPIYAHVYLD